MSDDVPAIIGSLIEESVEDMNENDAAPRQNEACSDHQEGFFYTAKHHNVGRSIHEVYLETLH